MYINSEVPVFDGSLSNQHKTSLLYCHRTSKAPLLIYMTTRLGYLMPPCALVGEGKKAAYIIHMMQADRETYQTSEKMSLLLLNPSLRVTFRHKK